jgi:hypothetical protein
MCGDTLLTLARRCGLTEVQKLLERVSKPDDNLPCAAAAPNSELYNRLYHIFHFCRPPYKIPFRAYNFNIFKCKHLNQLIGLLIIFLFSTFPEDRLNQSFVE